LVSLPWQAKCALSSIFFQKVSKNKKSKILTGLFGCIEKQASEIPRCIPFPTDLKKESEKLTELLELKSATDTDSDACQKERSVKDNEAEAEVHKEQEDASVNENLSREIPQCRDIYRS
jgi:hypothetical protein